MDQTDALIEALKAIIEQKDQQIADLRKLPESLQATMVKPLKNSAGNFLAYPARKHTGGRRRTQGNHRRR